MAIRTFDALGIRAEDDSRPIVIHSQFQRRDQFAAYKRIGVGPAYFTNHAWYWADVHRTNFPKEIVDFISPMKSAKAAGLILSNHIDFPVTDRKSVWRGQSVSVRLDHGGSRLI